MSTSQAPRTTDRLQVYVASLLVLDVAMCQCVHPGAMPPIVALHLRSMRHSAGQRVTTCGMQALTSGNACTAHNDWRRLQCLKTRCTSAAEGDASSMS
jgi:hypothetical protein